MRPDAPTDFGTLLRRDRLAAALTQEGLAERAGMSARGLQELERGAHRPLEDTVGRLTAALGLTGPERAAFARAAAPRPPDRGRHRVPEAAAYGLPAGVTSFIGRDRELATLRRLLATTRLLTLTGPGGAGKTRLAERLAATVAPEFAGPVVFISLAELREPALVLPAIARAFGVQPGRRELGAVLAELLRPRHLLLVLDNCEQVAAAAPALGALLTACPRLTLLATSRSPLQLAAEQVFPVPPLELPPAGPAPPLEELGRVEAVALFLARARAVRPAFALTAGNAAAVAGICRTLDGLPLALELAAARVRLLPPDALLARLEHRLALLTAGAADLPARQRTLRATLTWSYDLLSPSEQALFRRLGVFVGGCTLDMAEAVANAAGPLDLDLLDGLDALVRQSLVQQEDQDGEPRFEMLGTVREFALEQLALAGEEEATRDAHADALVRRLDGEPGPEGLGVFGLGFLTVPQLEWERENLRLALGWCAEQGDAERGLRLATRSLFLWWQAGPRTEGLAWLRRFLDRAPVEQQAWLRLRALWSAAWLANWSGETATARAYATEGLALAEARQDEALLPRFLFLSAAPALQDGDLVAAQVVAEHALALARRIGLIGEQSFPLMQLGTIAHLRGQVGGASAAYREALALRGRNNRQWALRNLGFLALEGEQPDEAYGCFHEALVETWSLRQDSAVVENVNALAALARERGQWQPAARLLGAADAGLERLGGGLPEPVGRRERKRTLAAAREHLGEPAFAAAYAAGRALALEQAVQEAMATDGHDG